MEIYRPNKVQVKKSEIHGWGVFATQDIKEGDIIEECPILFTPTQRGETNYFLIDYTFQWPKDYEWTNHVIALGYGSLYNHSNEPNADWMSDIDKKTFRFFATKSIKNGEEIFIYYGGDEYWNDGRNHINVK